MGIDKQKAKHHKWRIPEATLLLLSCFGGCIGGIIGMHLFHHKTKKWYFHAVFILSFAVHALILLKLYTIL
jgi:uncharacterized membrane protein YsdA (DUF1294 family)